MSQYVPKPFGDSGKNIKFDLDLSNYSTKFDLK